VHLLVQEPHVKKEKKSLGHRSKNKPGCDEQQQSLETDEAENEDGANDMKVTDTSLYWPRNRESASSAKTTADLKSLFPFEKESR